MTRHLQYINTRKSWDERDLALQYMYGLSLAEPEHMHPIFGSSIKINLVVGREKDIPKMHFDEKKRMKGVEMDGVLGELLSPTMTNLVWHFGFMEWALNNVVYLMRKSKGIIQSNDVDPKFFNSATASAIREFEAKMLLPLRKALLSLDHPLYMYCIPEKLIRTDMETGETKVTEGERVLSVLPKTVEAARYYGLSDAEILALAPQVLWIVKNMCGRGTIRTQRELEASIDQWQHFVGSEFQTFFFNEIEEKAPHLLTTSTMTQEQFLISERIVIE